MMMQDVVSVGSAIHQQINTCVRNYINKCVCVYIYNCTHTMTFCHDDETKETFSQ